MPELSYAVKVEDQTGSGLAAAHHDLDTLSEKSEHASESTGGLEGALTKLGVAAAGAGAVMGAKEFLGDSIGAAENLAQSVSKLQRTMGGTAEDASRMKFAIDEAVGGVGGNTDAAEKSMGRFAKTLAGLSDAGAIQANNDIAKAAKNLHQMGIEIADTDGKLRPMADIQADVAAKFGTSGAAAQKATDQLNLLGNAANQLGGDSSDIVINGSKQMIETFQKLGIAVNDAQGNALPMKDVLGSLADKFKDMPDGANKTALAMQLFGRQGADLIPFLNKGSEGVGDLMKESDKLGLTLSSNTINQVQQMTAAHKKFDEAMEGVKVQIGVAILPLMTKLAEGAAQVAAFVVSNLVPAIQQFAAWLGPQLTPILTQIQVILPLIITTVVQFAQQLAQQLLPVVQQIVGWLMQHRDIAIALGAALGILVAGPIALLIGAGVLIAKNWTEIVAVWQQNVLPVLSTVADWITRLGGAIQHELEPAERYLSTQFWPNVQKDFQAIVDLFQHTVIPAVQALVAFVQEHWSQIVTLFQGPLDIVKAIVVGSFAAIRDLVEGALRVLGDVITAAMDLIHGDWQGAWNAVKDIPVAIFATLKSLIGDALTTLQGILSGAWESVKADAKLAWDALATLITTAAKGVLTWITDHWKDVVLTLLLGPFGLFRDQIGEVLGHAVDTVTGKLHDLWSWITTNFVDPVKDAILAPYKWIADHGASAVGGVADVLLAPLQAVYEGVRWFGGKVTDAVNWVGSHIGAGNIVKDAFGMPDFPHFAGGTAGFGGGVAWVGELGPELVYLPPGTSVLPADRSKAVAGTPGFFGGVGDFIGDVLGGLGGLAGDALSFARKMLAQGAGATVDAAFSAGGLALGGLTGMVPEQYKELVTAVYGHVRDAVVAAVKGLIEGIKQKFPAALAAAFTGGDANGAGAGTVQQVEDWIAQAMGLAGVDAAHWGGGLLTIAMHESVPPGNPRSVNDWDVNAKSGNPSEGLMQTTISTFRANAIAGHGDIFNPVDNIVAAIGYIRGRYGDIGNVPGVASIAGGGPYLPYADGGIIPEEVWGVGLSGRRYRFGERGPERVSPGTGGDVHVHFHINAIDGASVKRIVPEIAFELNRFLKRAGQPGLTAVG